MEERQRRKLAVILHADVVGSTALVQQDETLAHERIQSAFSRFSETISSYGGVAHELRGDALVAEFERASDGVLAALSFQRQNAEINAELDHTLRPRLRVGISLGEVVIADQTITGAGVVLAQRVEQLAEPNGVCVTAAIHEAVPRHLPFTFDDHGKQRVKGFDDSVQVYGVRLKSGHDAPPAEVDKPVRTATPTPRRLWIASTVALLLVVVAGALVWWQRWAPGKETTSESRMAFPLPDKPSIAVLPFTNLSVDPEQEYFADGMAEDLMTDLSKVSGLFVISRNSTFAYKGKSVKIRQVAEELGVRYVLEGSVRRAGDEVRINAQLIDATTGGHLWADRYDGTLADVFNLQDQVTRQIVGALALELTPQEAERMRGPGTKKTKAHDEYLLGLSFYYRRTPEAFAMAEVHFEEAITLDPDYAAAHAAIAKMYAQVGNTHSYREALSVGSREIGARARIALARAGSVALSDVHVVRSWLALRQHETSRAVIEAERALDLNPNDVDALQALALARIYSGHPEKGKALIERAVRLNPALLARPLLLKGLAEFALGNSGAAVEHIERAFSLGSEEIAYTAILAAARGELGQVNEAEAAFDLYRQAVVRPDLSRVMFAFPFSDIEVTKRLARGLEVAGVKVWYTVDDGGYMPLFEENKLRGAEIQTLLSGSNVSGKEFWGRFLWERHQSDDGAVEYKGNWVLGGEPKVGIGTSRVVDDLLCDRWPQSPPPVELCFPIFRMPEGNTRKRWGDYVMVTDSGPHSFTVVQ